MVRIELPDVDKPELGEPGACCGDDSVEVIRVSALGLMPDDGRDATPVINRLLRAACKKRHSAKIEFENGRYDFYADRAFERWCDISNNTNGLKSIAFPMIGARNLEIDGQGALFVFHGLVNPFVLDECRDIVLRNFSIDWEQPFFSQARILTSNKESIDLEFEKGFDHEVSGDRLYLIGEGWRSNYLRSTVEFDPRIGGPAYMARDHYEMSNNVRAVALDRSRVRLFGGYDGHKVQKSVGLRPSYGTPRPGNFLVMKTDISRVAPGIAIKSSSGIQIENVDLHHACGMGVIAETSKNLTLRGVRAKLAPGSGRMVSLNADALHFVGCSGSILVEECVSEFQLDDALNIHGHYAFVTAAHGSDALEIALLHHEQTGFDFCQPGDAIEFHHRDTLGTIGEAIVCDVETINGRYGILAFDRPVASMISGLPVVLENVSQAAELTVRGCRAIGNRGRGCLIKSRGRTILKENLFSTGGSAILMEGKSSGFCESGPVREVLIENNDFVDCKRGPWGRAVIDIRPMPTRIDSANAWYHQNVRILGNRFQTFDPGIIAACCVSGLRIEENRIARTPTFPPKEESQRYSIELRLVRDAVVSRNRSEGAACDIPWSADEATLATLECSDNTLGPLEIESRKLVAIHENREDYEG